MIKIFVFMLISKVSTTKFCNLGYGGGNFNELSSIDGVLLSVKGFSLSIDEALNEDSWINAIKDGMIYPLIGLDDYEDESLEDEFYESQSRNRIWTNKGNRRYKFLFDCPLNTHRSLQRYLTNSSLNVFLLRDGKICFFNNNGKIQGFSTSNIIVGRMTELPADSSIPAQTPIYMDMKDDREWDVHGDYFSPDWMVDNLEPMMEVYVDVLNDDAYKATIFVHALDGKTKVPIRGITLESWDGTIGGVTEYSDNFDGTYTLKGNLLNGIVRLKSSSNMETDGLLITSSSSRRLAVAVNRTDVFANDKEPLTIGITKQIKEWFEWMNTEFKFVDTY